MAYSSYQTLAVALLQNNVLHVELNRPEAANAMNAAFWREMRELFALVAADSDVRVVVISGAGKHFSSGLDLRPGQQPMGDLAQRRPDADIARHALKLRSLITAMQESFTAITRCPQPVIAAIHGACVGVSNLSIDIILMLYQNYKLALGASL
jgi:enoyl-CoA hydratase/carnithine racemase